MLGIDTNVLLQALVDVGHPHHAVAMEILSELTEDDPGFVTQVTLAEFWVMKASLGLDKETILGVIRGLAETASLEFDDGEGVVRALSLAQDGADFPDALM